MEKDIVTNENINQPVEDPSVLIVKEYLQYVLEQGEQPLSVYKFSKNIGLTENEFYQYFNSFMALEKQIWRNFFEETLTRIESEEIYLQYSVREKLLAFYFTLVEVLKTNRSFVMYSLKDYQKSDLNPEVLKSLKTQFTYFINELLNEGKETDEIINRPLISDRYQEALWLQFMFILNFWRNDDSLKFEKTDAAIEKSVHLSFDLMGKSPLDTMVDFAKFIYQNR
ncbi:hypothetical protein BH23BAC1_BH23BAC1_15770 [soil metagenome]